MKTSITHIKYSIFLFLEDNDLVSAKSTAQIQNFLFLNFLITDLCNTYQKTY